MKFISSKHAKTSLPFWSLSQVYILFLKFVSGNLHAFEVYNKTHQDLTPFFEVYLRFTFWTIRITLSFWSFSQVDNVKRIVLQPLYRFSQVYNVYTTLRTLPSGFEISLKYSMWITSYFSTALKFVSGIECETHYIRLHLSLGNNVLNASYFGSCLSSINNFNISYYTPSLKSFSGNNVKHCVLHSIFPGCPRYTMFNVQYRTSALLSALIYTM